MKPRELNKIVTSVSVKGLLSATKAQKLPSETRDQMSKCIIRNRQPVAVCLLPDVLDESWLNSMGYMYHTTSTITGLVFRHTCEHNVK